MKRGLIFLFLLLSSVVSAATQVIVYVDPDATGAANGTSFTDAYTALGTALSTEAKDISVGTGTDEQYTFLCQSSSGTADTVIATVGTGWTTAAANYIEIIGFDFPADGIWDGTKYVLHNNDDQIAAMQIQEDFVRVRNLQVLFTVTAAGIRYGIDHGALGIGNDIRIDSCIVVGVTSGTGNAYGIYSGSSSVNTSIFNCTFLDIVSGADNQHYGILMFSCNTADIYNCTIYDCRLGIANFAGTVTATNCAVGNCDNDFATFGGTLTVDYCCSDDGDGTNSNGPASGNWVNELTDAGNGNFTPVVGGNILDTGTDDPGSGLFSDDIIGASRTSTWSRGAYEGIASSGTSQLFFITKDFLPEGYWGDFIMEGIAGQWSVAA